jgi:hypothetical protein
MGARVLQMKMLAIEAGVPGLLLGPLGRATGDGPAWQFQIGGTFLGVWQLLIVGLGAGYALAYFYSAGTVAYHLLARREGR